jgi:proteasome activator subunit 4
LLYFDFLIISRTVDFVKNSHKYWGKRASAYDLKVKWHIPSDAELDFAIKLIEDHLPPCIQTLRTLIAKPVPEGSLSGSADQRKAVAFEFLRWITLLRNIIRGMASLLPPTADNSELLPSASLVPVVPITPAIESYLKPSHPSFNRLVELRQQIGAVLVDLTAHLISQREDDTHSLRMVTKSIESFITNRGVVATQLASTLNGYNYAKSSLGSVENEKKLPRYLLIKKAAGMHEPIHQNYILIY